MLEVHDYSNRRGVLVTWLPKIHAMLTETAKKDTLAGIDPPFNIILWKQDMRKKLTEIHRRWMIAEDGPALAGVFFFHLKSDGVIHLDELRIAWPYRHNDAVFNSFIDRFNNDATIRKASAVFAGPAIKKESNQELLNSVGFEQTFENGLEPLGSLTDAIGALKIRYIR